MIGVILGTRPEYIKLWPVVQRLREEGKPVFVLSTGQHTALAEHMPLTADDSLGIRGGEDPYDTVQRHTHALDAFSWPQKPTWIVVQGDTASALAGARYAAHHTIPLCHVEAGLRSHDTTDPWPEEAFRLEIDRLATLKACPTEGNRANLAQEGLAKGSSVTGNPITDALRLMHTRKKDAHHVLITLHRRESFGEPMRHCVHHILTAAWNHPDTRFLWPMHPNPHVAEALRDQSLPDNLFLGPPLGYRDFLGRLEYAKTVITDSGGLVEECTTLGIPCLIARNTTERPEALGASRAMSIGRDGHDLNTALRWALTTPLTPLPIFGDGHTAPRITRLLT